MAVDPNMTKEQKKSLKMGSAGYGAAANLAALRAQAANAMDTYGGVMGKVAEHYIPADAPAPAPTSAPAPASAPTTDFSTGTEVPASAMAAGKKLPPGWRRHRYIAGAGTPIYVAKGKDGSVIFSDNPGESQAEELVQANPQYANRSLRYNASGPHAQYEVGENTLQHGGYTVPGADGKLFKAPAINTRAALASATPQQLQGYLDTLAAHSSENPETQLANRILADRIHLKQHANGLRYGAYGAGAPGMRGALGARGGLTEAQALKYSRMTPYQRAQLALKGASLRQHGAIAQGKQTVAQSKEQRAQLQMFNQQLATIKDPGQRATFMFNHIPAKPDMQWAQSPIGQEVLGWLNTDIQAAAGGADTGAGLRTLKFNPDVYNNFDIGRPSTAGGEHSASIPWDSIETRGHAPGGRNTSWWGSTPRFAGAWYSAEANRKLRALNRLLRGAK